MKQIIQSFKTGETILEEVPAPIVKRGCLLIQTTNTLVSLGTEKMLIDFGKSNIFSKALQQPGKVKQVIEKIKNEGFSSTMVSVMNKLEQPIGLGYCNVGKVIAIGDGVDGFKIGDRVASNGQHAEFVCVPKNLVSLIPDSVSDKEATFTVIGSIGLQGIRLLNPTIGEVVVVFGLGLIGLITVQLLIANGCTVIGVDIDDNKLDLAKEWGVIPFNPLSGNLVQFVNSMTHGVGCDGVIITASAKGNEIITQSAQISRKRGRIILIGVVGLDINRSDFYEKELTFQVSCSYGPGRYDEQYEQKGVDYPLAFVRWTENRNFKTILQSIENRRLLLDKLISQVVHLDNFHQIYSNIGKNSTIASIIEFPKVNTNINYTTTIKLNESNFNHSKGNIGVIGAGNFTNMTMLPILKNIGGNLKTIASQGGLTGTLLAKKYGFTNSTTDSKQILNDTEIDLVMITTRHDLHASQVIDALNSGKHIFVEKPLAINEEDLDKLVEVYNKNKTTVTVGFNRRFSPHSIAIKKAIGNEPINIIATMNAGLIPQDSWVHDLQVGGGRIIGEACHLIDLASYFTSSKIVSVCMNSLGTVINEKTDNASILLKYENGSNAVINYFSNGNKEYSKERVEIYSQQRTIILDNFIKTTSFGFKNFNGLKTRLDKGHKNQFNELINRVKLGGDPLIEFDSIVNTSKAAFAAIRSLKENKWVNL
jgi:predicted dehydrogenase/threonine dehydrogenase-like Zn-dependent dehydrogenase